jgi:hypothetical protein
MDSIIREVNEGINLEKKTQKAKRSSLARERATERQWQLIDIAIDAFARRYPLEWNTFVVSQRESKSMVDYALAGEGDLRKAGFRLSATFPAIIRDNEVVDRLDPVLDKIIPGLTHKDSVNFILFLKKYPIFNPGDKL